MVDLDKHLDRIPQAEHNDIAKLDSLEARGKWDTVHSAYKEMLTLVPPDGKKVIDIGCGGGWVVTQLAKTHKSAVGTTLSEEDAKIVRAHGVKVHVCDMHKMDIFEDASFGGVWASHVLEHSPAPYVALSEFARILKKDGWLFLVMPERDGIAGTNRRIGFFGTHLFCADQSTVIYLLRKAGFRLEWYREIPGYHPDFVEPAMYHQIYLARKGRRSHE